MLKVLFFGSLRDISKCSEMYMDYVNTLEALKESVLQKFPEMENRIFSMAVNEKFIIGNFELNAGDVVALMPPFSGG